MIKKRVVIESPYAGDVERNKQYALACMRHSLLKGESPLLSHMLYTQLLNDDVPAERTLGMLAGLAWVEVADIHAFYVDFGYSKGMIEAKKHAVNCNVLIEERRIYDWKKT